MKKNAYFLERAQCSTSRICIVKGWVNNPNDGGKDHTWCGKLKKNEPLFIGSSHYFLSFHRKEKIKVCIWCALSMIKTIILSIFK